jgi:hypothetical protein
MNEQSCPGDTHAGAMPMIVPAVKTLQTRFIHPFTFDRGQFRPAVDALRKDAFARAEGRNRPHWTGSDPHHLYQDELLDHVSRYLFSADSGPCAYLKIAEGAQAWFKDTSVPLPDAGKVHLQMGDGAGIELFLSSLGVGILSIKLSVVSPHPGGLDYAQVLDFNYRLAQHRRQDTPRIRKQHPKDDPKKYELIDPEQQKRIREPPGDGAPLEQRLGAPGGHFDLNELAARLLKPVEAHGLAPEQVAEFLVYTVARFGPEVDLGNPTARDGLTGFISALAQVEEVTHAGPPPGRVTVPSTVLNRCHWAAVGLLGAAHLIADQEEPGDRFNELRPRVVSEKYFIPYLLALQQRLVLNRAVDKAAEIVSLPRKERARELTRLREDLLAFGVGGHVMQVSTRHALHRYYRLARRGLGVGQAWRQVRQAVNDLAAQETTQQQHRLARGVARNLRTITNVQKVVHLIEYLLASVYLAHLWHMFVGHNHHLKELFGEHTWDWIVSFGVLVCAGIGFFGMYMVNQKIEHGKNPRSSVNAGGHPTGS